MVSSGVAGTVQSVTDPLGGSAKTGRNAREFSNFCPRSVTDPLGGSAKTGRNAREFYFFVRGVSPTLSAVVPKQDGMPANFRIFVRGVSPTLSAVVQKQDGMPANFRIFVHGPFSPRGGFLSNLAPFGSLFGGGTHPLGTLGTPRGAGADWPWILDDFRVDFGRPWAPLGAPGAHFGGPVDAGTEPGTSSGPCRAHRAFRGANRDRPGPCKCDENIVNNEVVARGHYRQLGLPNAPPGLPKATFWAPFGHFGPTAARLWP